jgi:hypothetical protein
MNRPTILGLALVVGASSCGEPSEWEWSGVVTDSAGVRVVELSQPVPGPSRSLEVDHGWSPGEGHEFGELTDLEVLEDGRVAALDAMNAQVVILDDDGVVSVLGGPGDGPGEFSTRGLVGVTRSDSSIIVPDLQLQRVNEFGLDGAFIGATSLADRDGGGGPLFALDWRSYPPGGTVFRQVTPEGDRIVRAHEGATEVLVSAELEGRAPNLLLPPTVLWDVDAEGRVVWGRSDQRSLRRMDPMTSEPLWIARWAEREEELTPDDEAHLTSLFLRSAEQQGLGTLPEAQRRQILNSVRFPPNRPVITAVHAGPDGTVWTQRARPVAELGMEAMRVTGAPRLLGGREWEVYHREGWLLELVTLPDGFLVRRFSGPCLYGILEDDLGLQRPARACVDP